ncbi:SGNH hydrolase-type esterase domain-containing protein [Plasmodiophora brassicae]|uniref:Uncharacterized protein n=1 Tax=Plasmodiophora brassicae TaxID=37360 RepID=A0A0G4IW24_PLABS|nr:hypothetical protein PBRA_001172 [Plasmodiophora brassicae]SPQ97278.1 unnamed protein product [Plasmodiophora brassicae]
MKTNKRWPAETVPGSPRSLPRRSDDSDSAAKPDKAASESATAISVRSTPRPMVPARSWIVATLVVNAALLLVLFTRVQDCAHLAPTVRWSTTEGAGDHIPLATRQIDPGASGTAARCQVSLDISQWASNVSRVHVCGTTEIVTTITSALEAAPCHVGQCSIRAYIRDPVGHRFSLFLEPSGGDVYKAELYGACAGDYELVFVLEGVDFLTEAPPIPSALVMQKRRIHVRPSNLVRDVVRFQDRPLNTSLDMLAAMDRLGIGSLDLLFYGTSRVRERWCRFMQQLGHDIEHDFMIVGEKFEPHDATVAGGRVRSNQIYMSLDRVDIRADEITIDRFHERYARVMTSIAMELDSSQLCGNRSDLARRAAIVIAIGIHEVDHVPRTEFTMERFRRYASDILDIVQNECRAMKYTDRFEIVVMGEPSTHMIAAGPDDEHVSFGTNSRWYLAQMLYRTNLVVRDEALKRGLGWVDTFQTTGAMFDDSRDGLHYYVPGKTVDADVSAVVNELVRLWDSRQR